MDIAWKSIVGSRLYGLEMEDSDTDYKGIFFPEYERLFPTARQIYGLDHFSPHEKQEFRDGEGSDKDEGMYYSPTYFLKLFFKGNPTLAELPFVTEKFIVESNDYGLEIMEFVRNNLITKHLFSGYYGFYVDQMQAFVTGKGRCREKRLRKGSTIPEGYSIPQELLDQFYAKDFESDWKCGNKPSVSKDIVEKIRHLLIDQGWYDGKMMSHAYRIGIQGIELFSTGKMNSTLEGDVLDVARRMKTLGDADLDAPGRISREDAIAMVQDIGAKLKALETTSTLPSAPNKEKTNGFILDIIARYYDRSDLLK